ncbi:uncharacterized protein LOC143589796 [Bidens hawaiensis]|uniref:uncharacterized protein LOC143589796 n=1 Tax=Bidens hawaiensis TaxID=980011 RepID=UPI0040495F06
MVELIKGCLGDEKQLSFWFDNWTGAKSLREACPILFKLETNKLCKVLDRFWRQGREFGWSWDWVRSPSTAQERTELEKCLQMMNSAVWKGGKDAWEWLGDNSGMFSVSSVKKLIVKNKGDSNNFVMKWSKWVPAKCNIHMWRAEQNRIPTRVALARRNVMVTNDLCALCGDQKETTYHIYTGCMVATVVWDHISRWCKVPPVFSFSVRDLLNLHKSIKLGLVEKEAFHGIVIVACWRIWKARNEKVFEGKDVKIEEVIGDIKCLEASPGVGVGRCSKLKRAQSHPDEDYASLEKTEAQGNIYGWLRRIQ